MVRVMILGMANSHSVMGNVYKAWEWIHRRMADQQLLVIWFHVGELQPAI